MEGCLLCLEINKAVCITGNSSQWEELDIKNIIEKHFWAMHTMQSSSWLCNTCWQELYDFHKFYIRIEESHMNFGKLMKTENEPTVQDPIDNLHDEKHLIRDVLYESQLEPEISMHETLPNDVIIEEQQPIKQEQSERLDDDEDDDDDMPLKSKRTRKRRDKDSTNEMEVTEVDPLNKPKKTKQCKTIEPKVKRSRKTVKKSSLQTEQSETEQSLLKQDALLMPEEANDSIGSPNANDSDTDSNYDFDKDSLENNETNRNLNSQAISDEKDRLIAENFKIICIICQIPMENFHLLRKHFKMEHKHIKKGYVICCNKKIFSRCALFDHVNHHLDPNYFKCQQCDKVFKDRLCLTGHLKRHEGNTEKKFSCDICDKSFSIPSLLKYHKMTHLPDEEKQFPCSECGKRFGTELSLTNHVRAVHLNKYAKICDVCGKSLSSADVFERHMLEHEGKTAPTISCDICGLLLTSKKGLKRHKNTIHPIGGHQEYTCSICSKISSNRQAHERHVKFSHEMGYNHKCTMCEKAFKKPRALKEHMATHTGDVLYTCQWCSKTFNSSANFHSHRKKAHPIEWEEANRKKYADNILPSLKASTANNGNNLSIYMHLTKNGVNENIK